MQEKKFVPEQIRSLRLQLTKDAKRASSLSSKEWLDPELWSQYMGADGRRLYQSYGDEELLDILRDTAAELGHIPSQKEVFCVYRVFIRRRFVNWPTALRAAGLKAPKATEGSWTPNIQSGGKKT